MKVHWITIIWDSIMDKLNKKFIKGNVLKAEELNEVVGKINELVDNSLDNLVPEAYSGNIDVDNMLIPVFDKRIQQIVFIPISAIQGGVTPPSTGFPYTFPIMLR